MSSVILSGDTSGAVTLTVPSVAGTNTVTVPASTGTVMVSGNMPAFYAYAVSTTSVSNGTATKVTLDGKIFDTNNNFASSRFTPTVAGYYLFTGVVQFANTAYNIQLQLVKNGSVYVYGSFPNVTSGQNSYSPITGIVYLNGSTDYVELYVYQASGSTATVNNNSSSTTWFQGVLARAA